MPHFKAFGMSSLLYEIETCYKIHNKGTLSQWPMQVTIILSGQTLWTQRLFFALIHSLSHNPKKNKGRCGSQEMQFSICAIGVEV